MDREVVEAVKRLLERLDGELRERFDGLDENLDGLDEKLDDLDRRLEAAEAPNGATWVCGACGKTARNRYTWEGGWDESCMLHAVLCREGGPPWEAL